jgi:hypothetical protein
MTPWENSRFIPSDIKGHFDWKWPNLKKKAYLETRPFHQKLSVHQKWPIYYFWVFGELPWLLIPFMVCFLCIGMCIQSSHTCLYIGISRVAVQIALNSIMPALPVLHAIALFSKFSSIPSSELGTFRIKVKSQLSACYPINSPWMQTSLNSNSMEKFKIHHFNKKRPFSMKIA